MIKGLVEPLTLRVNVLLAQLAMYSSIGLPPSLNGASKLNEMLELVLVLAILRGGSGAITLKSKLRSLIPMSDIALLVSVGVIALAIATVRVILSLGFA